MANIDITRLKPITFGDLKKAIAVIEEKKSPATVGLDVDTITFHLNVINTFLKEKRGIEKPTLGDVMTLLKYAPENISLHSFRAIVGRPDFETATKVGYKWLERELIPRLEKVEDEIVDLKGDLATYRSFYNVLTNGAKYVKWNGHGRQDLLTGQGYDIIIRIGDNAMCQKLRAAGVKVISALSCLTAAALGPWLVSNGCVLAYFGYEKEFIFAVGGDNVERPFFESDFWFDYALFDGETTREAFIKSQGRYEYWIENAPPYLQPYLYHDQQAAKLIGAKDITIYPEEPPSPPPQPPSGTVYVVEGDVGGKAIGKATGWIQIGRIKIPLVLDRIALSLYDTKFRGEARPKEKKE